jgi:tetratricopeptide (TPR) repeat protein
MFRRILSFLQGGDATRDLEHELEVLERGASVLEPEQRPALYEHAGDLCARADQRARALTYYDRAIDAYLAVSRYAAAEALCRKVIDRFPEVVRARGTLAFLSIAEGLETLAPSELREEARDRFGEYVRAARAAGREEFVARRLRSMADVTGSVELRELISDFLEALGDRAGAEEVFLAVYEEREGIRTRRALAGSQRERWAELLRRSVAEPEDMV